MPARLPSPALDAAAMASHAQAASALLKALAHPARLRVLCRLVEGEASVGELQAKSALSMSALAGTWQCCARPSWWTPDARPRPSSTACSTARRWA